MNDKKFKGLNHFCIDYTNYSKGEQIEKNYSPDFVLKKGTDFIILEHETEPNRKTILANIFKAAHFLQKEKTGKLIIVMNPKRGSSMKSYIKHSKKYFEWIKDFSNIEQVYFLEKVKYFQDETVLEIGSADFFQNSLALFP